jgi:penicillin-binding protein 1C
MRRAAAALAVGVVLAAAGLRAADRWIDATDLPNLSPSVSVTVLDRRGMLLRAFTAPDGRWRLPVDLEALDRGYLTQLLGYEDRRFHRHSGVDPWAVLRATALNLRAGRIVSGASTITMQLARLLEKNPKPEFRGQVPAGPRGIGAGEASEQGSDPFALSDPGTLWRKHRRGPRRKLELF